MKQLLHGSPERRRHIAVIRVSYIETIANTVVSKRSCNADVCDKDCGSGELDHALGTIVLIE